MQTMQTRQKPSRHLKYNLHTEGIDHEQDVTSRPTQYFLGLSLFMRICDKTNTEDDRECTELPSKWNKHFLPFVRITPNERCDSQSANRTTCCFFVTVPIFFISFHSGNRMAVLEDIVECSGLAGISADLLFVPRLYAEPGDELEGQVKPLVELVRLLSR